MGEEDVSSMMYLYTMLYHNDRCHESQSMRRLDRQSALFAHSMFRSPTGTARYCAKEAGPEDSLASLTQSNGIGFIPDREETENPGEAPPT